MVLGADRTGKPPLRCSLLLYSSLTLLPGQWDRCQRCKYTLGVTFVSISQHFLITCYKSFGRATITHHNIKHVLWHLIATHVAFYSRPGLGVSKRTWLIGAFIQHLIHFWLGFLGLFLDEEVQNCTPCHYFW